MGNPWESPLAMAIGHLRDWLEVIQASGNPSTWEALADYYSTPAGKPTAVLRALDSTVHCRHQSGDRCYPGGLSSVARKVFHTHPGAGSDLSHTGPKTCRTLPAEEGTVYLFADGLRMDLARALEEKLHLPWMSRRVSNGLVRTADGYGNRKACLDAAGRKIGRSAGGSRI